jgi:hypothetical protein
MHLVGLANFPTPLTPIISRIHPLSVVQSIIHTLWTFGNTITSLNHLDSHTYILVIRSHKKLDHADHIHLSRSFGATNTFLGHPNLYTPPLDTRTHMHLPQLCLSCMGLILPSGHAHAALLLVMYTFISRSYIPTYNIRHAYLIFGTTHTHISFRHAILHTPLLTINPSYTSIAHLDSQ